MLGPWALPHYALEETPSEQLMQPATSATPVPWQRGYRLVASGLAACLLAGGWVQPASANVVTEWNAHRAGLHRTRRSGDGVGRRSGAGGGARRRAGDREALRALSVGAVRIGKGVEGRCGSGRRLYRAVRRQDLSAHPASCGEPSGNAATPRFGSARPESRFCAIPQREGSAGSPSGTRPRKALLAEYRARRPRQRTPAVRPSGNGARRRRAT